ncbi:hypothetical protein HK102_000423 [Quaeritorhiza haematococci]|nr:hypothetical protein HK102_000423 [Quaeritorhiza haematococci]
MWKVPPGTGDHATGNQSAPSSHNNDDNAGPDRASKSTLKNPPTPDSPAQSGKRSSKTKQAEDRNNGGRSQTHQQVDHGAKTTSHISDGATEGRKRSRSSVNVDLTGSDCHSDDSALSGSDVSAPNSESAHRKKQPKLKHSDSEPESELESETNPDIAANKPQREQRSGHSSLQRSSSVLTSPSSDEDSSLVELVSFDDSEDSSCFAMSSPLPADSPGDVLFGLNGLEPMNVDVGLWLDHGFNSTTSSAVLKDLQPESRSRHDSGGIDSASNTGKAVPTKSLPLPPNVKFAAQNHFGDYNKENVDPTTPAYFPSDAFTPMFFGAICNLPPHQRPVEACTRPTSPTANQVRSAAILSSMNFPDDGRSSEKENFPANEFTSITPLSLICPSSPTLIERSSIGAKTIPSAVKLSTPTCRPNRNPRKTISTSQNKPSSSCLSSGDKSSQSGSIRRSARLSFAVDEIASGKGNSRRHSNTSSNVNSSIHSSSSIRSKAKDGSSSGSSSASQTPAPNARGSGISRQRAPQSSLEPDLSALPVEDRHKERRVALYKCLWLNGNRPRRDKDILETARRYNIPLTLNTRTPEASLRSLISTWCSDAARTGAMDRKGGPPIVSKKDKKSGFVVRCVGQEAGGQPLPPTTTTAANDTDPLVRGPEIVLALGHETGIAMTGNPDGMTVGAEDVRGGVRRMSSTGGLRGRGNDYDGPGGGRYNMYRGGMDGGGGSGWDRQQGYDRGGDQNGGQVETFFERRRRMREESKMTIWPPSPDVSPHRSSETPSPRRARSESPSSKKRGRDSGSDDSSGSDDDSSEDEKRKSKKKSKKSRRKSKSSKKRKDRKRKGRSKKKKDKSPSPSSSSASESSSSASEESDAGSDVEDRNKDEKAVAKPVDEKDMLPIQDYWTEKVVTHEADVPVGPVPLPEAEVKLDERAYGGALLAGEGSAMAAYIQSGKRIPRRGEIGLTSDEIESFEKVGYVMSGSRHRRMNAVRIRKENQVISAEEKRALLLFNQQEKMRKEAEIIGNFKELVSQRLKRKDGGGEGSE